MSRVLVIDDDPGSRRILESRLALRGHEVVTADTGALGTKLLRESRFDLLLLSATLRSGVDGFEVCRRARALPDGPRPGIVLHSEQVPVPELIDRGYEAGCDAFVTRPELPGLEHVLDGLARQMARQRELEAEVARLAGLASRAQAADRGGASSEPAVRDREPRDTEDRAAAVRELACYRPDGVLVVDSEGSVRHADRGAYEMFGGGIEGRHLGDLAPAAGLEAFVRDARLETREGFRFDLSARKGHPARGLSATVVPLVLRPGESGAEIRVVLLHDAARRRVAADVLKLGDPRLQQQEIGPLLEAAREAYRAHAMIGASTAMREVRRALAELGRRSDPVLLLGEPGSGKERAARILHYAGSASGTFVQLSCAGLSPESLAVELFGHVRGATRNALADRPGLFHLAQDGTLYLEEVAEASPEVQESLLAFLEEGTVRRIGSRKAEPLSVRLVVSSSAPIEGRVREERFSEPLFRRLEACAIPLPPLDERPEDVEPIARHYVGVFGAARGVHDVASEAVEFLTRRPWPGNVSELIDCVEQACAAAKGEVLELQDLPGALRGDAPTSPPSRDVIPALPPSAAVRVVSRPDPSPRDTAPRPAGTGRELRPWDITDDDPVSLDLYEKKALLRALDCVGGDRLAAARLLKVGKSTLYRKLKQFGIG